MGSINIQKLEDDNMRVFYCTGFHVDICIKEVFSEEYLTKSDLSGEHVAKKKG